MIPLPPGASPYPAGASAAMIASGETSAAESPVSEEPPKPFYMTVPGALGIAAAVLVIGGIAAAMNQKRTRRDLER